MTTRWRKSSFSGGTGGNCVEVSWRKSSFSGLNGDCVEVAFTETVSVRDSKNTATTLTFEPAQWRAFTARQAPRR